MDALADTLSHLHRALGDVITGAFDADAIRGLSDDELLGVMGTAAGMIRRLEAVLVEGTGQVQDRSETGTRDGRLTERLGCRSVSELVQRVTLSAKHTVRDYEHAARGVQERIAPSSGERLPAEYPAIRAALIDGQVGVDGVVAVLTPLGSLAGRAGRVAHLAADEELAASARGEGVDGAPPAGAEDLRALAQVWAVYLDPDGAEPRETVAMRNRGLHLGTGRNGLIPIRGNLLPETAAQLQRIFDALLNPKLDGPRFTTTHPG
ncbi:MAG TPA: DUF222 domain-containing protein, partial [Microbacterium sp.]|uniref:DUF222 domain-containing protein n=1 Tax=Microbacterium sp. TaxID=51671 RepID=UPI002CBB1263